MKYLALVIIFLISSLNIFSQQKTEVRAVWLSTNFRLDWPSQMLNEEEQKAELIRILDELAEKKFNTIYFQVRSQGSVLYRSNIEPWSPYIKGELGKSPSYDPLQFIIDEARKRNMELHAWMNVFLSLSGSTTILETTPRHIILKYPEWHSKNLQSEADEYWLNPGLPEARNYLLSLVSELVRNYKIDGIHFDYIRYPGKIYDDQPAFELYGKSKSIDNWRRENINLFISAAYDTCLKINPFIKVGAAPLGIYRNVKKVRGLESRNEVYQDSREWLRRGRIDYLAPQIYWELDSQQDFKTLAEDWAANFYDRHIYIGIGAYKKEIQRNLTRYFDVIRKNKFQGISLFRYGNISGNSFSGFTNYANIPPMRWKDNILPNRPGNLFAEVLGDTILNVKLRWEPPLPAIDGDTARYYNIYRGTQRSIDRNNSSNIIRITGSAFTDDEIKYPSSLYYYYQVSSFDKCNNESFDASPVLRIENRRLKKILSPLYSKNMLYLYPQPVQDKYLFVFDSDSYRYISVGIYNLKGEPMQNIFTGYVKKGSNVFQFDKKLKGSSKIKIIVTTGTKQEEAEF